MPNEKWTVYKNHETGILFDITDADAQGKLTAILDGTTIDSFGDVETDLATKVDKVAGKGLSTNDYDDTEKTKVAAAFPRSEQAVLGAVNILVLEPKTVSRGGITFVANGKTVRVTGTLTEDQEDLIFKLPQGIQNGMKLTGCPSGGSISTYMHQIYLNESPWTPFARDFGEGATIQGMPNDNSNVYYGVKVVGRGNTFDLTFEPMVSFEGGDYVEPALTNRGLTEENAFLKGDTIALDDAIINGFITTGASELHFELPIRAKGNISNVAISNNTKILIRGNKGYLKDSGGNDIAGDYSFSTGLKNYTAKISYFGSMRMVIKNSDDGIFGNVDNNTPISAQLFSGTLTL